MQTFIDCLLWTVALFIPLLPVMYVAMLIVADTIITAVRNWNE